MGDTELGQIHFKDMEEDHPRKEPRPHWFEEYVQPCLAELLGTMLFVFAGCLSVIENSPNTGSLQPALAHGLALGLTIAILGGIRYMFVLPLYVIPYLLCIGAALSTSLIIMISPLAKCI